MACTWPKRSTNRV